MTDAPLSPAAHARVAEFLQELSEADLAALAEGRARLAVLPADPPRPAQGSATRAPASRQAAPAVDLGRARATLDGMASRADGTAYLASWPVRDLRALAAALELRGVGALRKPDLVDRIVDRTIGFRLNSSAIRRL